MIYKGTRIYRLRENDIEKGDVGWLPEKELAEVETPIRFLLSDVITWEVYKNPINPFKQQKQVLSVDLRDAYSTFLIIESVTYFDKLMEDFKQGFNISFKNQ